MSRVESWNGISTKVKVVNSSTGAKVSVYKSTSSVSGLNGRMDPYYKNSLGGLTLDSSFTNVWAAADAFGFDNKMDNVSGSFYFGAPSKIFESHANVIKYDNVDVLEKSADAIVVASPEKDLSELEPTLKYTDQGRLEDYYTVTNVKSA